MTADSTKAPSAQLPTMQCNALRMILGKREVLPTEVAQLDYHLLVRAPRIGNKGIVYIRNWLQCFGLDIANYPPAKPRRAVARREQQVLKAVGILRRNGFEVQVDALIGSPANEPRHDR